MEYTPADLDDIIIHADQFSASGEGVLLELQAPTFFGGFLGGTLPTGNYFVSHFLIGGEAQKDSPTSYDFDAEGRQELWADMRERERAYDEQGVEFRFSLKQLNIQFHLWGDPARHFARMVNSWRMINYRIEHWPTPGSPVLMKVAGVVEVQERGHYLIPHYISIGDASIYESQFS